MKKGAFAGSFMVDFVSIVIILVVIFTTLILAFRPSTINEELKNIAEPGVSLEKFNLESLNLLRAPYGEGNLADLIVAAYYSGNFEEVSTAIGEIYPGDICLRVIYPDKAKVKSQGIDGIYNDNEVNHGNCRDYSQFNEVQIPLEKDKTISVNLYVLERGYI